jgi:hypothetical protein
LSIVSGVAGQTVSKVIISLALIAYNLADTITSNITLRAVETNLIGPIPFSTSDLSRSSNWCKVALSLIKSVSSVAGQAVSKVIISFALVVNDLADTVIIDISLRTLKADLVSPIPFTTSDLRRTSDGC